MTTDATKPPDSIQSPQSPIGDGQIHDIDRKKIVVIRERVSQFAKIHSPQVATAKKVAAVVDPVIASQEETKQRMQEKFVHQVTFEKAPWAKPQPVTPQTSVQ